MRKVVTNITIVQQPNSSFLGRKKTLRFSYCNAYNITSSWANMTDRGAITLPRHFYFIDENDSLNPLNGTIVNVGGFKGTPLFMRGDKIKLEVGYNYNQPSIIRTVEDTAVIFEGYITKVGSSTPLVLEVED